MSVDEKVILIVVGFIILSGGLGLWSTIVWHEMVEEVNRRLSPERRFEPLGWYPSKSLALIAEYRRLYPEGLLYRRFLILTAALFSLVIALALWLLLSQATP